MLSLYQNIITYIFLITKSSKRNNKNYSIPKLGKNCKFEDDHHDKTFGAMNMVLR